MPAETATCVGVDGCKAGWIAAVAEPSEPHRLAVYPSFGDLITDVPPDSVIAVDMPIGLPDRIEGAGRPPEKLVRSMLGERQSSVFAIPARPVVECGAQMTGTTEKDYPLHQRASALAKTLSEPPKGVSIQAFYLFPKILEIDELLRGNEGFRKRVFESHPEVAFTVLNGGSHMRKPKKVKGKVNPAGMEERTELLLKLGVSSSVFDQPFPKGAGDDDVLDALVCSLVARRIVAGEALSFPDPPVRDAYDLPVAIWA